MQGPKKLSDTQILTYNPNAQQQKKGEEAARPPLTSLPQPGSLASPPPAAAAAAATNLPGAPSSLKAAPVRTSRTVPGVTAATVMHPHISLEGNLRYSGTLTLDCEFRGSVTTEDTLVIGTSGRVNAEITAGIVEIAGKVQGNIRAKSRVKILTGGEVYGNIETATISMEEGVVFEGNCARLSTGAKSASPQAELDRAIRKESAVVTP